MSSRSTGFRWSKIRRKSNQTGIGVRKGFLTVLILFLGYGLPFPAALSQSTDWPDEVSCRGNPPYSDILRGCYDGESLDPTFCSLFTRISDPNSGFFGGLNFLQTGQINFAKRETSGYDMELIYNFDLFAGDFMIRANAEGRIPFRVAERTVRGTPSHLPGSR